MKKKNYRKRTCTKIEVLIYAAILSLISCLIYSTVVLEHTTVDIEYVLNWKIKNEKLPEKTVNSEKKIKGRELLQKLSEEFLEENCINIYCQTYEDKNGRKIKIRQTHLQVPNNSNDLHPINDKIVLDNEDYLVTYTSNIDLNTYSRWGKLFKGFSLSLLLFYSIIYRFLELEGE